MCSSDLQWKTLTGCPIVRCSTQTIITSGVAYTPTTVVYGTAINDTTGWYNSVTGVFRPTVPGFYQINANVRMVTSSAAENYARIMCNGTIIVYQGSFGGGFGQVATMVCMNGSTDALCIQFLSSDTGCTVAQTSTRFSALLVYPG